MDEDESSTNSDVTPVHQTKKSLLKRPFHSYCTLTITTPPARKAIDTYRKNLCYFYTELLDVDEEACLIVYQSDPKDDNDFKNVVLPINQALLLPNDIPKSIT